MSRAEEIALDVLTVFVASIVGFFAVVITFAALGLL